jgi:dual specificity tyrosine-phosphorylation-regulated kinase 2/3/4
VRVVAAREGPLPLDYLSRLWLVKQNTHRIDTYFSSNLCPTPLFHACSFSCAQIQQLFEDAVQQLPDISLRPDSAACAPTRIPSRSLSQSGSSSTAAAAAAAAAAAVAATTASSSSKLIFPLTPQQAIEKFRRTLTMYELEEIHQYAQVYFVGPLAKKINARDEAGPNSGYDDEKGRYKLIKNDHIGYRYEVLKGLGRGSFGEVVRTFDHKTQQHYALKIIRNERRFHKQGQIEIKILEHLRKEDRRNQHNIIHFKEWFLFRNHICITFELLHVDLYTALKNDSFRGFGTVQVQHFAFNMLVSLRLLHKSHIVHCDLKPENILLCRKDSTDIKVIDFGSACFDTQRIHTYIQSRFYRSPEVILGGNYGMAIDMWSLGCILVELATGQPLFPGHDEKEQLLLQMEVLGIPAASLLEKAKRFSIFFDSACQPRITHDNKGRARVPASRPLPKVLGRSEPDFEDFVLRCLRWDPDERMTPKDALRHPFVAGPAAAHKIKRTVSDSATAQDEELLDGIDALALTATTRTLGAAIVPLPSGLASSAGLGVSTPMSSSYGPSTSGLLPSPRAMLPPVVQASAPARHPSIGSSSLGTPASSGANLAGYMALPPPPSQAAGRRLSGSLNSAGQPQSAAQASAAIPAAGILPPPAASSSAYSSSSSIITVVPVGEQPSAGSGVPGLGLARRNSGNRLTGEQQAHAERIRAAINVNGSPGTSSLPPVASSISRHPSMQRDKGSG